MTALALHNTNIINPYIFLLLQLLNQQTTQVWHSDLLLQGIMMRMWIKLLRKYMPRRLISVRAYIDYIDCYNYAMATSLCLCVMVAMSPIEWCIGEPRSSSMVSHNIQYH